MFTLKFIVALFSWIFHFDWKVFWWLSSCIITSKFNHYSSKSSLCEDWILPSLNFKQATVILKSDPWVCLSFSEPNRMTSKHRDILVFSQEPYTLILDLYDSIDNLSHLSKFPLFGKWDMCIICDFWILEQVILNLQGLKKLNLIMPQYQLLSKTSTNSQNGDLLRRVFGGMNCQVPGLRKVRAPHHQRSCWPAPSGVQGDTGLRNPEGSRLEFKVPLLALHRELVIHHSLMQHRPIISVFILKVFQFGRFHYFLNLCFW